MTQFPLQKPASGSSTTVSSPLRFVGQPSVANLFWSGWAAPTL